MVDQYFFVPDDAATLPIHIDFKAPVNIRGNLFSDQSSAITTLQKLQMDAVARLGNMEVKLDSSIIFRERLLVNQMQMQVDLNNLVRKSVTAVEYKSRKQFNRLIASRNIITPVNMAINIGNFNDHMSLKNRLSLIITTLDKTSAEIPTQSDVIFEKICTAQSIDVQNVNFIDIVQHNNQNYDINEILQNVINVREHRIQMLMIDGYVIFDRAEDTMPESSRTISRFNDFEFNRYMNSVILYPANNNERGPQRSLEIGGEKTFISELNITSAHTTRINKRIQTSDWLENAFRLQQTKKFVQQILESPGWEFFAVTSDNFDTQNTINGIEISSNIIFVDDNPSNTLTIVSDISISNMAAINTNSKLVSTELRPCSILTLIPKSVYLMQRNWNEINVIGNVKVVNKESNVDNLATRCRSPLCFFEMALSSGTEESINTNIVFNLIDRHDKFSFNQIVMPLNSPTDKDSKSINNINLLYLFNDAITRTTFNDDNQPRTAIFNVPKKLLATETIFNASDARASKEVAVKLINNINVNNLNRMLFMRSTTREMIISISQKFLFLDAPIVRTMTLPNRSINGIDVSTILFAHSNQSSSLIFQKNINELTTKYNSPYISGGTVYVSLVNGISFEYFIDNRCKLLYRTSKPQTIEGYYSFENLILTGEEVMVQQINDVPCDEIVLRRSDEKQLITGDKRIEGDYSQLIIQKPFHIWKTNDVEFVATFAKSILLNHKQSIERIIVQNPYQLNAQRAYTRS